MRLSHSDRKKLQSGKANSIATSHNSAMFIESANRRLKPVAQKLDNTDRTTRDAGANHFRDELMKESQRKAQEILRGLEERQHSDTTTLVTEDRKRCVLPL